MDKVTVDAELRTRLNDVQPGTEICDPSGRTLGFIVSPDEYLKLLYALERERPEDLDELRRISQEPGGRPLKDIWKDLGRS